MKIFDIAKRVWNSDAMDTFADITMGTLECLGEAICEVFSQGSSSYNSSCSSFVSYSSSETDYYTETYEYWKNLDYEGQKYYFESNEYLKDYIDHNFYENDKELTAQHVAYIADKLNRSFNNIYSRY